MLDTGCTVKRWKDIMSIEESFQLMSKYNQQMNSQLFDVSSMLTEKERGADQGVFFDSVLGTLNHILVGDRIWLKRFCNHPTQFTSLDDIRSIESPKSLSEILYPDFSELRIARQAMDEIIIAFAAEAKESDYEQNLKYANTKGKNFCRNFGLLNEHLYNHQTHHRGQVTALLSQFGKDYGSTDLLNLIPDFNTEL